MDIGERVTWEDCPICHRPAAVGWRAGQPVEFDCPRDCRPTGEQVRALRAGSVRPMVERLARRRPAPGAARRRPDRIGLGHAYPLWSRA